MVWTVTGVLPLSGMDAGFVYVGSAPLDSKSRTGTRILLVGRSDQIQNPKLKK